MVLHTLLVIIEMTQLNYDYIFIYLFISICDSSQGSTKLIDTTRIVSVLYLNPCSSKYKQIRLSRYCDGLK